MIISPKIAVSWRALPSSYTRTERRALRLRHAVDRTATEHSFSVACVTRVAVALAVRYDSALQWCTHAFRMSWCHIDVRA